MFGISVFIPVSNTEQISIFSVSKKYVEAPVHFSAPEISSVNFHICT